MSSSLEDSLKRFGEQFEWHPVVENADKLSVHNSFYVAGLGGSHLGARPSQGRMGAVKVDESFGVALP